MAESKPFQPYSTMSCIKNFFDSLSSNKILGIFVRFQRFLLYYYIEILGSIFFLAAIITRSVSLRSLGYGVRYNTFVDGLVNLADISLLLVILVAFVRLVFVLVSNYSIHKMDNIQDAENINDIHNVHTSKFIFVNFKSIKLCDVLLILLLAGWVLYQFALITQLQDFALISYTLSKTRFVIFVGIIAYLLKSRHTIFSQMLLIALAIFGMFDHFLITQSVALVFVIICILAYQSFVVRLLFGTLVLFNGMVAVLQLLLQQSIGLKILGESVLSTDMNGVAEIQIMEVVLLRGYGLFAHPNILSFVGVLGMILVAAKIVEHIILSERVELGGLKRYIPSKKFNIVTGVKEFNALELSHYVRLSWNSWILCGVSVGAIMCIATSFSRMGIIAMLGIGLVCGLKFWKVHITQIKAIVIGVVVVCFGLLILLSVIRGNSDTFRLLDYQVWIDAMSRLSWSEVIWGIGPGQYSHYLMELFPEFNPWRWQPAHNIILNLVAELGIVGVIILIAVGLKHRAC